MGKETDKIRKFVRKLAFKNFPTKSFKKFFYFQNYRRNKIVPKNSNEFKKNILQVCKFFMISFFEELMLKLEETNIHPLFEIKSGISSTQQLKKMVGSAE